MPMKKILNNFTRALKKRVDVFLQDPLCLSRWVPPYLGRNRDNQISVRVGNEGYRWVIDRYHGDVFMFIEDMHQGIMPFMHLRSEDKTLFRARLEPENAAAQELIVAAMNHGGRRYDLADALCEFIRTSTQELFFYGRVIHEIVYETDANGMIMNFAFVSVNPLSIRSVLGPYYQVIPWKVGKRSYVRVGVKRIPKEKLQVIEFPVALGGRRTLKRVLSRLSSLSAEPIPEFQMEAMRSNQDIGFDLNQYVRAKYLEKAQLTRQFGWDQRKRRDQEITEYYSVYRHLCFALSQAIIREHILGAINRTLSGPLLNIRSQIIMEGLPTSDQIKTEFRALNEGGLEFVTLFKRTSI